MLGVPANGTQVHESVGPNGERIVMTIRTQVTTGPSTQQGQPQQIPQFFPMAHGFRLPVIPVAPSMQGVQTTQQTQSTPIFPPGVVRGFVPSGLPRPPFIGAHNQSNDLQALLARTDALTARLERLETEQTRISERYRDSSGRSAGTEARQSSSTDAAATRVEDTTPRDFDDTWRIQREGLDSELQQVHHELRQLRYESSNLMTTLSTAQIPAPASLNPASSSALPLVYLLSSPAGPSALVLSPHGTFSTPPMPFPQLTAGGDSQLAVNAPNNAVVRANFPPNGNANVDANIRPDNGPPNMFQPHAAMQLQQELIREIASHLWLIIRVLGFIWFFAGGRNATSWRSFLPGVLLGLVIILVQAGPLQQHWQRLRRYWEGLLPARANVGPAGQHGHRRQDGGPDAQAENGDPIEGVEGPDTARDPRERIMLARLAERLARAQESRTQQTRWRQQLRTVERAVALFFASLWPGVGERLMETRRRLEEEEIARRAEEEARRRLEERRRCLEQHGTSLNQEKSRARGKGQPSMM